MLNFECAVKVHLPYRSNGSLWGLSVYSFIKQSELSIHLLFRRFRFHSGPQRERTQEKPIETSLCHPELFSLFGVRVGMIPGRLFRSWT